MLLDEPNRVRQPRMRLHKLILQARADAARMHGYAPDVWVPLRQVLGEQDVGEFRVPIAGPGTMLGHGPLGLREDEAAARRPPVAFGAEADDADVGVGLGGGFAQGG